MHFIRFFLTIMLPLCMITACAVLKDNRNSYLKVEPATPPKLPVGISQDLLLGDARNIPELTDDQAIPHHALPRRPQPDILPEQKQPEAEMLSQQKLVDKPTGIYTNTDNQPMLVLASDSYPYPSWKNVGEVISKIDPAMKADSDNTYYAFTYQGRAIKVLQIRMQDKISLIIQDQYNTYLDSSQAEALLFKIQHDLTSL